MISPASPTPIVVCLGSLNMDMCIGVAQAPVGGETVAAKSLQYSPGGKGANQAVSCARQGVRVRMVGNVGADHYGKLLLDSLNTDGIDTANVTVDPQIPTGLAVVVLDDLAQNRIVVVGGANLSLQVNHTQLAPLLADASALVMQLESPISAVHQAAQWAKLSDCKVVFNPSPVSTEIPDSLWPLVDLLVLNESEASSLSGLDVSADQTAAIAAARYFQAKGIPQVVITLGGSGALAANGDALTLHPAPKLQVVDTTAAGDTFLGALVAGLARQLDFPGSVSLGIAAASLCVQTAGAQISIPTLAQSLANFSVPDWANV